MRTDPDHIGIWGRTKSGKSTRARAIIRARPGRLVVFDLLDEYGAEAPHRAGTLAEMVRGLAAGRRVRFVPDAMGDTAAQLDAVAEVLTRVQAPYKAGQSDARLTFVVEEMADSFPNVRRNKSAFGALCRAGRHWGIALIGISQRMADVSTSFRNCTAEDYFFPLRTATDYDTAAAGVVKAIQPAFREALLSLRPHEFIAYKAGEMKKGKN